MFSLLVEKELKNLLLSTRFVATFAACTVLILTSVLAGIVEYRNENTRYQAASALVEQELSEATAWGQVGNRQRVYRAPDPMQIFASGIHFDIGRFSVISSWQDIRLQQSAYSIEPLFAVFRAIDFVFIVQVVLSLLTIVFAYDLVSGEKESGTLRLMLANAVPRTGYITAKLAGAWAGLMIPLLIPMLLGVLLLMLFQIPFSGEDWMRLGRLAGISVLYLTAFLCLGILFSTLTHRSSQSFLALLVFWIVMVLVVPRGGMMIASQMVSVPSASEVESQKEGFAQERRTAFFASFSKVIEERMAPRESMSEEEWKAHESEHEWEWMVQDDELRAGMEKDLSEHNRLIDEEVNNRNLERQNLGFLLSRASPASAFQLAAMRLGGTDLGLKQRFTASLQDYRTTFRTFIDAKSPGGMVTRLGGNETAEPLDLSEMPRYNPETVGRDVSTPVDAAILFVYALGAIALALVSFNRYDVR